MLTFDQNTTSIDVPISLINDLIHELDETFGASLQTQEDPNVVMLAPASATIRVLDDDGNPIMS